MCSCFLPSETHQGMMSVVILVVPESRKQLRLLWKSDPGMQFLGFSGRHWSPRSHSLVPETGISQVSIGTPHAAMCYQDSLWARTTNSFLMWVQFDSCHRYNLIWSPCLHWIYHLYAYISEVVDCPSKYELILVNAFNFYIHLKAFKGVFDTSCGILMIVLILSRRNTYITTK